jgi:hypothetical protein
VIPVIGRAQWGAKLWRPKDAMYRKAPAEQRAFFVHYHGGPPPADRGVAMAREVEAIHLANGWAGVGYSFMVGQDGGAFEGRGWDLVTAACPDWNRQAWHVYVAVGGAQVPTTAALRSVRALYDEACRRAGRQLTMTWHGAHYSTDCPGKPLITWVQEGMRVPSSPQPAGEDDDMATPTENATALLAHPVATGEKGSDGHPLTLEWMLIRTYQRVEELAAEVKELRDRVEGQPGA